MQDHNDLQKQYMITFLCCKLGCLFSKLNFKSYVWSVSLKGDWNTLQALADDKHKWGFRFIFIGICFLSLFRLGWEAHKIADIQAKQGVLKELMAVTGSLLFMHHVFYLTFLFCLVKPGSCFCNQENVIS